jgi:hypothetical protein
MKVGSETANLELTNTEVPISSNYEQHALGTTARTPSGTFETLSWTPSASHVADSAGETVYAVEVRLQCVVRKNVGYRLRRSVSVIGALTIVVTAALLADKVGKEGASSIWSLDGLRTFIITSLPIIFLKVLEERFRQ